MWSRTRDNLGESGRRRARLGPLVAATAGTPIIGLLVAAVNRRADRRRQLEYPMRGGAPTVRASSESCEQDDQVAARLDWQPRRLLWERARPIDVPYIT
jgi:hypothetical protein